MEKSHESALFPGVMPVFEMTSEKESIYTDTITVLIMLVMK